VTPGAPETVLEVRGLAKTFVSQRALAGVDFDVRPGEVHALVGHNGSGKSTLIKILAGFHDPDPGGTATVAGTPLRFGDPDASRAAGLRFIHQELGLVDDLTVLENLRLGGAYATGRLGRIRWRDEREAARRSLRRVHLSAHPDARVAELSPIQRTQLAVARALDEEEGARVLFLDEPTATLPHSEVERLFELIEATRAHGLGIVYISHRLEEIERIADRVTVLRDGQVVGTGPRSEFGRDRLVDLIIGLQPEAVEARDGSGAPASERALGDEACLRFTGVQAGELRDATFELRPGEVVGMAGLAGSGVHDVVNVLLARTELEGGTIDIAGTPLGAPDPDELRRRRAAVLPSQRALKSIPTFTVRENLTLPDLTPLWNGRRLRRTEERRVARELIRRFDIRPPALEKPLMELSGGNQQKVAVAKWLRTEPRVFVLDEPTQGVDVGGKGEILQLLRGAARGGVGVLICSSDLEDLELVCDRVLVVRDGGVRSELTGAAITRERISEECYRDGASNA
jgi:ribose transport system ATP-binding protein